MMKIFSFNMRVRSFLIVLQKKFHFNFFCIGSVFEIELNKGRICLHTHIYKNMYMYTVKVLKFFQLFFVFQ